MEKKTKKKTAKKVSKGHLKLVKQVDKRKVPEKGTDKKQKPVKTIQRKGAKNTPSKEKQVKKQPVKKISIINRRLKVLLFIFISILVLLLIRIAYIQFIRGEELRIKAFEQQTKTTVISPERGIIYDRNSMELAVNVKVKTITINPVQIKENEIGLDKIANDISEILGSDKESILKKFKKDSLYEIISRKIDVEVSKKLEKYIEDNGISGFDIYSDTKRYYPEKNIISHVIGFTGIDNEAREGLEKYLDPYLKGIPGKTLSGQDRKGRELSFDINNRIEEKDGLNAVLTIDINIQRMVSDALDNAIIKHKISDGACAIAMDPWTGEILAMVSKPDFDSNSPWSKPYGYKGEWSGYTQKDVNYLYRNNWKNKSIQETYEPGSTFKAITSAAGLEESVITPETIVNDDPIEIEDRVFNCWSKTLHGEETFREAIYNSCNPVFVSVANKMGIDKFYSYLRDFGFYDLTGIDLIGETNSIIHEKPSIVDMSSASFGQRFTITPVQLICAYNAIINGGDLLKPLIVKTLIDNEGSIVLENAPVIKKKVISKETSAILTDILEGVVSVGTGKNAYVRGYRVAGKTGTSETTVEDKYIASFMSFAPADRPVISLLVVLKNPAGEYHSGGSVAAPVAAELIEEILDYMNVEREYTKKDEELIAQEVFVPNLKGLSIKQATERLRLSGLGVKIPDESNEDDEVLYQNPLSSESIPRNSFVTIYSKEEKKYVIMPDIKYKTVEESIKLLHDTGLNIKITGIGRCISQQYEKGIKLEEGTLIKAEFRYTKNIE